MTSRSPQRTTEDASRVVRAAVRRLIRDNTVDVGGGYGESLFGAAVVIGAVSSERGIETFSDYMVHPELWPHAVALIATMRETADAIERQIEGCRAATERVPS